MKILKLEPFAGLSGDMFLGLFADLGDYHNELMQLPKMLNMENELDIKIESTVKKGIACKQIRIVDLNLSKDNHSHRHLSDIYKIIDNSLLDDSTKNRARAIFSELGKAESEIHGVPIEKIHFHEVGAIDSIADIVGAAWLFEKLNIDKTYCETVNTGWGFVNTEHGRLPVPAPATHKLLLGIPTTKGEVKSEMVTPTGAAILRNINPEFEIPTLTEVKVGYGPGEKEFTIPNVLRGSICKNISARLQSYIIECNIDDGTGEYLGRELQEMLFSDGALEVYLQPVVMKKSRMGTLLKVIANEDNLESLTNLILTMTSSIGLRYYPVNRKILKRKHFKIDTEWGKVRVKESILPDGKTIIKPESDDIMRIAQKYNLNPYYIKNKIAPLERY